MLNPSHRQYLTNKEDLHLWQQQLTPSTFNTPETQHIPFHSGWAGYYPYSSPSNNPSSMPLDQSLECIGEFHYYPWSICLDHDTGKFHLLGKPDSLAHKAFKILKDYSTIELEQTEVNSLKPKTSEFRASEFKPFWGKSDYRDAFFKIQEYLKAGDCYQVNLTQPHFADFKGSAIKTLMPLYTALNPSFGCYFKGKHCELVSLSPERFMSINAKGHIEAKPIKGTIKRSDNELEDQYLIDELTSSAKNQAENLMIVDLLRNDLSMSAEPSSVKVEKLFELETHPNVHHLVSTISAKIKKDIHPSQAISRAFPGGSITGAPKKRAMEIINELETLPRSLYCGSFGYYSDSGHSDFNILIRSIEFRDQKMSCWGGGGITVDSNCDEEYEESLTKIRRIMDILEGI